jgi:Tol biopolymer transport system component
MRAAFIAAVAFVAAGCGGGQSPTAGELRVRAVQVGGAPRVEGERTLMRVEGRAYELRSDRELRLRLPVGRHALEVQRSGRAGGRCSRKVTVSEDETTLAIIRKFADMTGPTLGQVGAPCRVVAGTIGIAYAQDGSIWFAAGNGSNRVRLGPARSEGPAPVLSPDGRWVASARVRPRAVEVVLLPTAGGRPILLRRLPGTSAFELVWAPDSSLLAVSTDEGLYLLRPDASSHGFRLVTAATGTTFSPDGRWIAYVEYTGVVHDIYAREIGRGETRRVTGDGHGDFPSWGARGLAFTRGRDVWAVPAPGARPKQLTRTGAGIVPLAWSADGSRLLAASTNFRYERLWAIDGATGKARRLKNWAFGLRGQGLSYNGRTILAATGCAGPSILHGEPQGTIETIPFEGGKPRVILKGPCYASWNE